MQLAYIVTLSCMNSRAYCHVPEAWGPPARVHPSTATCLDSKSTSNQPLNIFMDNMNM